MTMQISDTRLYELTEAIEQIGHDVPFRLTLDDDEEPCAVPSFIEPSIGYVLEHDLLLIDGEENESSLWSPIKAPVTREKLMHEPEERISPEGVRAMLDSIDPIQRNRYFVLKTVAQESTKNETSTYLFDTVDIGWVVLAADMTIARLIEHARMDLGKNVIVTLYNDRQFAGRLIDLDIETLAVEQLVFDGVSQTNRIFLSHIKNIKTA